MLIPDVCPERRRSRRLNLRNAFLASCSLAVSVGWLAAHVALAEEDTTTSQTHTPKIQVSAEAVYQTHANPFALKIQHPANAFQQATVVAEAPNANPLLQKTTLPPNSVSSLSVKTQSNPFAETIQPPPKRSATVAAATENQSTNPFLKNPDHTADTKANAIANPFAQTIQPPPKSRNRPTAKAKTQPVAATPLISKPETPVPVAPAPTVNHAFVFPETLPASQEVAKLPQPACALPAAALPAAALPAAARAPSATTAKTIQMPKVPASATPFEMPEQSLRAIPVATTTRSRVVDTMSLGDELSNANAAANASSTESTKVPEISKPDILDGYSLAAPRSSTTSTLPTASSPTASSPTNGIAPPSNPTQSGLGSYKTMPRPSLSTEPSAGTLRDPAASNSWRPRYATSPTPNTEPTGPSPPADIATQPGIVSGHSVSHTPHNLLAPPPQTIPHSVSHGAMGQLLDPYRVRASETVNEEVIEIIDPKEMFSQSAPPNSATNPAPDGFQMWWETELMQPIGFTPQSLDVDVASLTQTALASSPFVRSLLTKPHIRRSDIVVADAEFDPTVYLEGRFTDTNDPVGSALTTGDDSDRFRDETFSANGGVRKKTRQGANLELAQRGGFQENNSTFLDPNPQGTTRLEFNFTQPLMRDRGSAVNNIRVLLAQLDLQISNAEVRGDLENHLIDVTRAYWDLYQARAQWLQRKRLLESAQRLHQVLQSRGQVDSQQRQILRARAALTTRKSDLVRITTRIRDAQSRLRLLTGSQQLIESQQLELTPLDKPLEFPVAVSTRQSVITALDNRPDIASAIRRIQAVSARVGVARNQVLPRLDLILGTYVAGLDDNRNTFGAWANQFGDGRPTYWAGLAYELPVGNRANKARLNRNRWEMSQVMHDFQQATEVAFTEVELAVRETQTAYNLMVAKKQAIDAAAQEVNFLQQRWELLPDPNESAVLLIEDLLDAQERLADEEQAFVAAQVAYAMSWIQLRKVTGVLLRFDVDDGEPVVGDSGIPNSLPGNLPTILPHSLPEGLPAEQPARELALPNAQAETVRQNTLSDDFKSTPMPAVSPHKTQAQKTRAQKTQARATSYSTGGNGFSLKDSLR